MLHHLFDFQRSYRIASYSHLVFYFNNASFKFLIMFKFPFTLPPPHRTNKSLTTERILSIVYLYITSVEGIYPYEGQAILPHGESFQGAPMTIHVKLDSRGNMDAGSYMSAYSNYPLRYLRTLIAQFIDYRVEHVQLCMHNNRVLTAVDDRYSLESLGMSEHQVGLSLSLSL